MKRSLLLFIILILLPLQAQADCVILLHGLARTNHSMTKLEKRLSEKGYQVINVDYPSRTAKIEILSQTVIPEAIAQCDATEPLDFVTHSMGGILVRHYLQNNELPRLKRVVMLGPPNQGSEAVDALKNLPGFHFLNGDAGMELGTDASSVPNKLGKAEFDLGIIAGTHTINLFLSLIIPGTDDGKVSVERTKVEGMHDHIEMGASHPFLMKDNKVIDQILFYLKNGQFNH